MPELARVESLPLRPPARGAYARLSFALSPRDAMHEGNDAHYLLCGASALTALHAACLLAGRQPRAILDFGAGAGRVTRWLRAHWEQAEISATDLPEADLGFCAETFGCRTFPSSTDVAQLEAPGRYDLIWAGSVLTHLAEDVALALLQRLLAWTRPGGLVVASLHGPSILARGAEMQLYGLSAEGWAALQRDFAGRDYAYADYPHQQGYGISVARQAWAARLPERLAGTRLVLFGERLWDNHHDVVALQREA